MRTAPEGDNGLNGHGGNDENMSLERRAHYDQKLTKQMSHASTPYAMTLLWTPGVEQSSVLRTEIARAI